MNYEVEITRHNVTLAGFLGYVKRQCKTKGLDCLPNNITKEEFEHPKRPYNYGYTVADGKKHCHDLYGGHYTKDASEAPCQAETLKEMPLDYQTYLLTREGHMYNEIMEFTFDDERTGTGYYYQADKNAK